MVKNKFNVKKYVLALVTVGFGGVIAGYVMTFNSDAFLAAKTFLINNPKVIGTLGPIKSIRLGLNYAVGYKGGEGSAKIKIILVGEHKSAEAYLTLDTLNGVWRVESANLLPDNENLIPLLPKNN